MKKHYITPDTEIIKVKIANSLLTVSATGENMVNQVETVDAEDVDARGTGYYSIKYRSLWED